MSDFLRTETDQQLTGFISYLREQYMLVNKYMTRLGSTFDQDDSNYDTNPKKYPLLPEYSSVRTLHREIKASLEDLIHLQLKLIRNSKTIEYDFERKKNIVGSND